MKYKSDRIFLNDISKLWLEKKQYEISETTYAIYYTNIKNHIEPYFQNIFISEIDTVIVNNFVKEKLERGKLNASGGLSVERVKVLYYILKNILYCANSMGYITQNIEKIRFPQKKQVQIEILSAEQQKQLEQVLYEDKTIYKIRIIICLYTGIRIGEVCALKWKDIQFENAMLHIHKTVCRTKDFSESERKTKLIVKEPKTKHSVRYIPLGFALLEYLKKYKQEDDYFILNKSRVKPLDPRTYQNQFYSYLKKCNIKKMKFHILRHTFATRWIENNCDIKSLSEILGHSNITITMNTYVHPTMELKREGMKKLEQSQKFL